MQLVIRRYRPQDRDAVCNVFVRSVLELIRPCFYSSVSSPLHLLITLALCAAGYLLGSALWALVVPGVWIALIYSCCHNIYSSYVQLQLQTVMKDICRSFFSGPDDCFWVAEAEIDGRPQIIGTMAIKIKLSGEEPRAELLKLAIASSHRRRGFGTRMVKVAIDFCKERGVSRLMLKTSTQRMAAVSLYQKLGFSIVSTIPVVSSYFWVAKLARIKGIRMELSLASTVGGSQFSWREHAWTQGQHES